MHRRIIKIFASSICTILPFAVVPRLACGDGSGDVPPTLGTGIIRKDIMPNGIRWGVWGAEGYVAGEAYCTDIEGDWNNAITVPSGDIYFIGGGSALKPKLELTIRCPYHHAFILDGTSWSWD